MTAPSPGDSLVNAPPAPPATADPRRRIERLLLLRTLVITVVLGLSLWLLVNGEAPARAAVWLQSSIIGATYVAAIVFGVMLRRGVAPATVAKPMLATDVVLTALLVYITGGAGSPYVVLFALTIVAAGALAYRRGATIITIAAVFAMIAISVAAWLPLVRLPLEQIHPWEQPAGELVRAVGINAAALFGVGVLSYLFGDQLQRGAETLATTRRAAADLLSLHQDIVRSLSSGLITTSPDGSILTANHAASHILGVADGALEGRALDGVLPGIGKLLAERGDGLQREDLEVDAAGRAIHIGVTVSPLRDVRDQAIGHVIHFADLTELRRLELHARRAERLATVGQLAAGVAHEIRNPLASISGSIELLRQAPQASDDDRALMTIVHREIQRLNVLIGDLLDYANPRPSQLVDFDLAVLIDETLQVARGDAAFAAIELAADVVGPIPIKADAAKLRQVVWNLVRNAADAAATGGKHVTVMARATDAHVTLSVADDGPGIEPANVARIFDPFFTTKRKGTGLGLATCHAIVAEHGGRIDVDTALGKGTTMVVTLPRTG